MADKCILVAHCVIQFIHHTTASVQLQSKARTIYSTDCGWVDYDTVSYISLTSVWHRQA